MPVRTHVLVFVLAIVAVTLGVGGIVPPTFAADDQASEVVIQDPTPSGSTPSVPNYQIVTPTPGTGTVVVVTPPPSTGSGPSTPQYQVEIPGPNPAQNTGVGQGEQLGTPGHPVTVEPVPGP